jgi:hypothetical protein
MTGWSNWSGCADGMTGWSNWSGCADGMTGWSNWSGCGSAGGADWSDFADALQISVALFFASSHASSCVAGLNLFINPVKLSVILNPPRMRLCFLRWRRVLPYLLFDFNVCAMFQKIIYIYIYLRYKIIII